MMWWQVLLVLGMARAGYSVSPSNSNDTIQEDAIAAAVDSYNNADNTSCVFKLLALGAMDRPSPHHGNLSHVRHAVKKAQRVKRSVLLSVFDLQGAGSNLGKVNSAFHSSEVNKDNATGHYHQRFTIKETNCEKSSKNNTQECTFKNSGMVKNCSALVTDGQASATVIGCDPVVGEGQFENSGGWKKPNSGGGKKPSKKPFGKKRPTENEKPPWKWNDPQDKKNGNRKGQ